MRLKIIAVLLAGMLGTGCSGLIPKLDKSVDEANARAQSQIKEVGRVTSVVPPATSVVHTDGIWIAHNSVRLDRTESLPTVFYETATFDRTVYSLGEFAERVTLRSGLPTKVAPDAAAAAIRNLQSNTTTPLAAGGATPIQPTNGAPTLPPVVTNGAAGNQTTAIRIAYANGSLKGLLDTVAARFGVSWKYVGGTVKFFYTDTRTFQISAIPGDSALTASVASSSNSDTSDASQTATNSAQNTAVKSELAVFPSIEKSITSMLSPVGKVVSSPATGSITVTDTPDTLERVAVFVDNENKALSRQIMVNVTVLAVTLSDGDSYGINWGLVYKTLSRQFGINNTIAADASATSFSAAILSTSTSKLAGSSIVLDALSSQGKVRRETTASVATLNNQPVPVQVAKQTSFLKSSQTTVTANVGTTTTLNPGTVTSGFNMTILPHVLNNGTVLLQFSTDISSLRRIRTVTSNDSTIETPELDTRNFLQRVAMKSGETLIISGFEQIDDNLERQGTGHPSNFLFGGGVTAASAKEVIVILITPITMNGA